MGYQTQATTGEPGDAANFSELIKANMQLYSFRNGHTLSTHAAANYTRNELATALRKARQLIFFLTFISGQP